MQAYNLPIHFGNDEGKHKINAESLAVFIEAYREIFEVLVGSKVTIEIGLPEEGGWGTNLTVLGVIVGITNFVNIDNLSILVRGKPSADMFYAANEFIANFITQPAEETSETYPRKCIEQKNKIYQQFQKDKCIDSFDLGDIPPIPKRNFDLYIKKLPDDEIEYLGVTNITVSSPVWHSKSNRSWLGKIEIDGDKECAFDFDKNLTGKFWERVVLDALPLHTTDIMSVQIIHRPNNKIKYRVIRVLKYNDTDIDEQLGEEEIAKITTQKTRTEHIKMNDRQSDFFDKF